MLRALKARLAPSDAARSLDLEQQYERLRKGPSNRQNVEAWLDDYLKMYTLAKESNLAEIKDSKRAYRDFLHAIEKVAPTYAETLQVLLDDVTTPYDEQLLLIAEKFRHHMRLQEAKRKGSAAATLGFRESGLGQRRISKTTNENRNGRVHSLTTMQAVADLQLGFLSWNS